MARRTIGWLVSDIRLHANDVRKHVLEPAAILQSAGWTNVIRSDVQSLAGSIDSLATLIVARPIDSGVLKLIQTAGNNGVRILLSGHQDSFGLARPGSSAIETITQKTGSHIHGILVSNDQQSEIYSSLGWDKEILKRAPIVRPGDDLERLVDLLVEESGLSFQATDQRPKSISKRARYLVAQRRLPVKDWPRALYQFVFGADDRHLPRSENAARLDPDLRQALISETPVLLWFGEHGDPGNEFGLLALTRIAHDLEQEFRQNPFKLVVLSDSRARWEILSRSFKIDTCHIWFSRNKLDLLVGKAAAVLLPVRISGFGISNPYQHSSDSQYDKLVVLARGEHPAIKGLDIDASGAFGENLKNALHGHSEQFRASSISVVVKDSSVSMESALEQWETTVQCDKTPKTLFNVTNRKQEKLLVCINLFQDVPRGLYAIDRALARGLGVQVVAGDQAVSQSSILPRELAHRSLGFSYIDPRDSDLSDPAWLGDATMLFCPSESSAGPHSLAHRLTKLANKYGVRTFTSQNGFEQAGLTYDDPDAPNTTFESATIFTWNPPELLPDAVSEQTRKKCVGVGRFLPPRVQKSEYSRSEQSPKIDVCIFENLHWGRYDSYYRDTFLSRCVRLAEHFPNHNFLLVPHPAGVWVTRKRAVTTAPKNLTTLVRDAKDNAFELTNEILSQAKFVITSPSTILVDAAEYGCAVAVAVHGDIGRSDYSPLTNLRSFDDWVAFVGASSPAKIEQSNRDFLREVRIPGDSEASVFSAMLR